MSISELVFYLRAMFILLFLSELIKTRFRKKKDKIIWFFTAIIFGSIGYFFWISFKRKLVMKRNFNPDFNSKLE